MSIWLKEFPLAYDEYLSSDSCSPTIVIIIVLWFYDCVVKILGANW